MINKLFKPFFNKNTNKLDFIRYNTIGKNKNKYFDFTASGLAFRQIENRIFNILETYGNTHSKESFNADLTSKYFCEARKSLAKHLEIDDTFAILENGYGSTSSIKHFQEILGIYTPPAAIKRYNLNKKNLKNLPLVIIGPYEHHSNELSFREALCDLIRIPLTNDGLIDLQELEHILIKNKNREIIGSFSLTSNVTGIISPYKEISKLLKKYNALRCFDAAAFSPYMNIPCEYYDVLYLSPHKLLGGPGSCGLLIIKKYLVDTSIAPTFAGGGTVKYVNKDIQEYENDIEIRENAGTPGILQFIKAALAYQLRNEIGLDFIEKRKKNLTKYLYTKLKTLDDITIYGNFEVLNNGIISFNIKNINAYDLCAFLSTNFGLQTRAGCSCAGPYGHDLFNVDFLNMDTKPGWLRISIHYSQTEEDLNNLFNNLVKSIKILKIKN